jgi:DNA-binding transcriptional LysR family regulator
LKSRFARPATGGNGSEVRASTVLTANRGLAINDYVLVIQAVLEGQGVALGWQHLTERLVASGLLRKVTELPAGYRCRI